MSSRFVRALVAMACCLTAARADVLVVKPSGGDFTEISAAVAAAKDGDIVLVEFGPTYSPFAIDGKSLTVAAASADAPPRTRVITVRNLAPGQSVLLRGLVVQPKNGPPGPLDDYAPGLQLEHCQGSVRVEDCLIRGSDNQLGYDIAQPGASVIDCVDVGLEASSFTGGPGASPAGSSYDANDGGSGLVLQDSHVWVHDSVLFGSDGGSQASNGPPHVGVGDGGDGALLQGASEIALAGSLVVAGNGGVQQFGLSLSAGGNGVHVVGVGSVAHVRDTDLRAGRGTSQNGRKIAAPPGTVQLLTTPSGHFGCTSVAHEGETIAIQADGETGQFAALLVSLEPRGTWVPRLQGAILVATPSGGSTFPLGIIPRPGALFANQAAPELGPGVEGLVVYLQLTLTGPRGTTLENGRTMLLLDGSF